MREQWTLGPRLMRRKVIVAIAAVYLVLVLVLSFAYRARTDRIEREQFAESTARLLDQSIERAEELFRRAQSIGETLRANPALPAILRKTYDQASISEELDDFFALNEIQNSLLFVENRFDVRLWIDNEAIYTRERTRFFSTSDLSAYLNDLPSPTGYATMDWRITRIRDELVVIGFLPLVDLSQFPTQIGFVSVEFDTTELDTLLAEITDELGGAVEVSFNSVDVYSVGTSREPSRDSFVLSGTTRDFDYEYDTRYPPRSSLDLRAMMSLAIIWVVTAVALLLIGTFVAHERGRHLHAEMEAQFAHIDPHFLYNTLDAVAWEAREVNAGGLSRMISLVSTYYRRTHNPNSFTATVDEEISAIRVFLDIQMMRSTVNCEIEISVNDGVGSTQIPKMLLQPVVENAFVHGVMEREGGGRITVTASRNGKDRIVRISDNGPGMERKELERVNRAEPSTNGSGGYGIANIRERIRLHYGPKATIRLESAAGAGTTVILVLPG